MTNGQTPPMAQPRVAAGSLFVDGAGRVMLVRPSYKPGWDIPGGYVEPGESPREACIREIREELSIDPPLGPLLVADWAPNPGEGDKILFVFDGGQITPEQEAGVRLDPAELSEYAFVDPGQLNDVLTPRLARRLTLALSARRLGHPLYAEHGRQPASAAH